MRFDARVLKVAIKYRAELKLTANEQNDKEKKLHEVFVLPVSDGPRGEYA